MAVLVGTKIVAPNIWGWLADRSGKGIRIIRVASFLASLAFLGVFVDSGYYWMIFVTLIFSFFWNAALPQFEAVTLSHLADDTHQYSRVRLWGSIGFIVTVMGVGILLDYLGLSLLPGVISLLLAGIWLISLLVPEAKESRHDSNATRISHIVRQPSVLVFFLVVCLVQVAHGPYYVFFSIYLEEYNYSSTQTGLLWSLGVFAEVALFVLMHRILKIISLRHILMFSVALGIIRWSLLACCVDQIGAVIVAQILHAATFGSTHIAAIHFVHRYFPGCHRGKGQALYSSISFGLGGMIGSYISGVLWDSYGAVTVYYAAAGLCLCTYFIALCWLEKDSGPDQESFPTQIIEEEL